MSVKLEGGYGKFPADEAKFEGEWIGILDDVIVAHDVDLLRMTRELEAALGSEERSIVYHKVLTEGVQVWKVAPGDR